MRKGKSLLNRGKSNEIWIVTAAFPIAVPRNGIYFGDKSIKKVELQSKFGLILQDSENISLLLK